MTKNATAAAETAAPALPTPGRFELVPLGRLVESPTNHRRTWGDLDELAASIRAKGVLEPILVRPRTGLGSNLFEIVFGHRRSRAATKAGLAAIPAMIRELSDLEVLEAQVVENLQRADVHPLEEAEGYEQLLAQKERPYTVDEIAAKVGKSKAYVYARLKLTDLCQEARDAFYDGKRLTPSTALLVARLPEKLQKEALDALKPAPWEKDQPKSFREAADLIHERFHLRLAEAPWDRTDATLLPPAGACSACPKRSGAQPELFTDVDPKRGDVCTDRLCFQEKKKAWAARRLAEAEAKGVRVIAGAAAEKVARHGTIMGGSGLIDLNDECWTDPKERTYRQLLGKKAPVVLVQTPKGELLEAVEEKAALDLLKQAGHDEAARSLQRSSSIRSGSDDEARKRENKRRALKRAGIQKAITAIVNEAESRPWGDEVVRFLADALIEISWHDVAVEIAKRRGVEFGKGQRPEHALEKDVKGYSIPQLRGLIVELLVTRGAYFGYQLGHAENLKAGAKLYGVDLAKMADEAKAEARAREAEKKARKSGKATKTAPVKAPAAAASAAGQLLTWVETKKGWKGRRENRTYVVSKGTHGWTMERAGTSVGCGGAGPFKTPEEAKAAAEQRERDHFGPPKKSGGLVTSDVAAAVEHLGIKSAVLTWHHEDDGRVLGVAGDGLVYSIERGTSGKLLGRARWQRGRDKGPWVDGLEGAKKDAERAEIERLGDARLDNAGDGELTKKELKGAAVTPKKGRR